MSDSEVQVIETLILGVVLFRTEWRLALYLVGFIPVVLLVAVSFRRLARVVTRQGMQAMGIVNATIKETVSGIAVASGRAAKRAGIVRSPTWMFTNSSTSIGNSQSAPRTRG